MKSEKNERKMKMEIEMNDENEMKMNAAADKPPRTHVGHGPEVQSD
jgi:hypothetical protein